MIDSAKLPKSGTILCGRYEVVREVGKGGMAVVYEAFDRVRQESVALKLISPQLRIDPSVEKRFIDEATLTSRLSHPRIINVHDIEHSEYGMLISMELLQGRTLRKVLADYWKSGREVPVGKVASLLRQIGEALNYAHLFTVHRDLKPENIWVDVDGHIKLMDFGLAKIHSQGVSVRTQAGTSLGTPYYVAPEQLSASADIGPKADQYSLAAIAYEMLTGEVPAGVHTPVHVLRSDVPQRLSRVVERGLARDPVRRFDDVMEFVIAFCEPYPLFRKYLDSPQRLLTAGVMFFLLGVFTVAVFEQLASLLSHRLNETSYWERTVNANQAILAQEWSELFQKCQGIGKRLEWLRSDDDLTENTEALYLDWKAATARILGEQALGLSGEIDRIDEETRRLAVEQIDSAQRAADRSYTVWQSAVNTEAPSLIPDLNHLADPSSWMAEALNALEEERFEEASTLYERVVQQHREWGDELDSLNERTFRRLESVAKPSVLYTNTLGMVFAKLPQVEGVPEEYWVSVWETRVIDYARYVSDGLGWASKYSSSDLWRSASGSALSFPVAGVSKSEAINFCRWLDQRERRHHPNRRELGAHLLNRRVRTYVNTLLARSGFREAIPEGIYAFGDVWPPMNEVIGFTGDRTLDPRRYILRVALGEPNSLGLFDFDRNIWEFQQEVVISNATHWEDNSLINDLLVGGDFFGEVTIAHNSGVLWPGELPANRVVWPGETHVTKIGRAEGIGFRIMLSTLYVKEREHLEAPLGGEALQGATGKVSMANPQ